MLIRLCQVLDKQQTIQLKKEFMKVNVFLFIPKLLKILMDNFTNKNENKLDNSFANQQYIQKNYQETTATAGVLSKQKQK